MQKMQRLKDDSRSDRDAFIYSETVIEDSFAAIEAGRGEFLTEYLRSLQTDDLRYKEFFYKFAEGCRLRRLEQQCKPVLKALVELDAADTVSFRQERIHAVLCALDQPDLTSTALNLTYGDPKKVRGRIIFYLKDSQVFKGKAESSCGWKGKTWVVLDEIGFPHVAASSVYEKQALADKALAQQRKDAKLAEQARLKAIDANRIADDPVAQRAYQEELSKRVIIGTGEPTPMQKSVDDSLRSGSFYRDIKKEYVDPAYELNSGAGAGEPAWRRARGLHPLTNLLLSDATRTRYLLQRIDKKYLTAAIVPSDVLKANSKRISILEFLLLEQCSVKTSGVRHEVEGRVRFTDSECTALVTDYLTYTKDMPVTEDTRTAQGLICISNNPALQKMSPSFEMLKSDRFKKGDVVSAFYLGGPTSVTIQEKCPGDYYVVTSNGQRSGYPARMLMTNGEWNAYVKRRDEATALRDAELNKPQKRRKLSAQESDRIGAELKKLYAQLDEVNRELGITTNNAGRVQNYEKTITGIACDHNTTNCRNTTQGGGEAVTSYYGRRRAVEKSRELELKKKKIEYEISKREYLLGQ